MSLIYYLDAAGTRRTETPCSSCGSTPRNSRSSARQTRAAIGGACGTPVLDDLGLAWSRRSLASSVPRGGGHGAHVELPPPRPRGDRPVPRVAQEALHNVAGTGARTASVSLVVRPDDQAELRIP
ncbi:hypothetical protein HBB16_15215 [Pseudonocardia sp. MCCB 268]|nr:hypothetical protein [Pseudonocardia cytotoxica]